MGALNPFLAVAPNAQPLCGAIGALVSITDLADEPPRALANGEVLDIGGARDGCLAIAFFRRSAAAHCLHE